MSPDRVYRRLIRLVIFAGLLGSARNAEWQLPDRWNPFAPLSVQEAPGPFTRYKLARLADDPAACRAILKATAFRFKAVAPRASTPGCELDNVVRIDRTDTAVSASFMLSCPAAVSLAIWELHTVQPAAQRIFGEPVERIEHLGSYACRNVYHREHAPRSQHATANAIDISGFELRGGRRVSIGRDWAGIKPRCADRSIPA